MFGIKKIHEEKAFQAELEAVRAERRNRFRMLECIDGSDASYEGLRFAAKLADHDACDIILLYVRPIDHGLRTGGLQVRVARENMLDWGLDLPGLSHLKRGLEMLVSAEEMASHWSVAIAHTDTWGDPLGDNKVEYRHQNGKSIVLKLKTAPDPASGTKVLPSEANIAAGRPTGPVTPKVSSSPISPLPPISKLPAPAWIAVTVTLGAALLPFQVPLISV